MPASITVACPLGGEHCETSNHLNSLPSDQTAYHEFEICTKARACVDLQEGLTEGSTEETTRQGR